MAETSVAAPPVRGRSARVRRGLLSLVATATLALGSLALPVVAQAAESPSFTADVTEVADTQIDVAIEGTGYGDVKALPGQTEPHVYFTLIEKGADLANVGQADTAVSASVATDGTVSEVLTVPAEELDETKSYEVISWPSRSFPTEANIYARTDVTIDWTALFPEDEQEPEQPQPATPSFTADVTEVADTQIDVAIEGTGYGDVKALPGQTEPHVYFTLIEKGADLANVGQADTAVSASVATDGTVSEVLTVPAEELDETKTYEVISWPSRSFPTEANIYARTDVTIDWTALFPAPAPTWDPQLTVTPATDLDPAGDTVTVTGTGYNPAQGIYVFLCTDVDLPADLWQLALGCRNGAKSFTPGADGTFEIEFSVKQLGDAATSVYTAANHTAQSDRTQDAKATLAFAEPVVPEPEQPATPSFTADVTEVADTQIDVAIEGTGYGAVKPLPGQTEPHVYFTLIEKGADLANVGQADTAVSASVATDGTVSEVLTVPADELDETKTYEVISWPSRSFPTEANIYARTVVTIDWTALFPEDEQEPEQPEEPSVALTGPNGTALTSIRQGEAITFTVSPVTTGTAFEVTIHSDPITLPELAVAGADGIATATWTVPADFETGQHTVTFAADDLSYSATFEVLAAAPVGGSDDDGTDTSGGAVSGGSAGTSGSQTGQLAITGGNGAGIALSAAALLMLVGAGVLVAARRRTLTTDQV
jgi:nucleoside 2-deoxyribosyltransferase